MMPMKCRSCKFYCTIYKRIYHGTVEGCGCDTNKPYPVCYEKKEDADNGPVGDVQPASEGSC